MLRQRTVVGVGEAMLVEDPRARRPGGLALRVAMEAARLGHVGVPVSRLGQDRDAAEILEALRAAGVVTEHVQSDPDLPTGRVTLLPRGRRLLEPAAYLNLQWDFDLLDLAQRADVVVFGCGAAASAQSRSVIQQFVGECGAALRLLDLMDRPEKPLDRVLLQPLLRAADAVLLDAAALGWLVPACGPGAPEDAAAILLRQHELDLLLLAAPGADDAALRAWDGRRWWPITGGCGAEVLGVAALALVVAVHAGAAVGEALGAAARVARFASDRPGERVPESIQRGAAGP
jgi:fructokinase